MLQADIGIDRDGFDLAVDLEVASGRVLAVLGPNGAGKTTAIDAISGALALHRGLIVVDGEVVDDAATGRWVAPERRRVGLVPQDLLLFPTMTVRENVAFGLRARGLDRHGARRRADEWLERFDVASLAERRPDAISGGQAQRVALARALATHPGVLLLDEPLAALDQRVRRQTRQDLRHLLRRVDVTTVFVTHDPIDALVLADDVAILDRGRVIQAGPIADVAARPRDRFVADLVGTNLLTGDAAGTEVRIGDAIVAIADPQQGPVFATIDPSAITLHRSEPDGSARNRWPMVVTAIEQASGRMQVALTGALDLRAEITPAAMADLGASTRNALAEGDEIWAAVKASEVRTYPR